jgi:hypothetical protein
LISYSRRLVSDHDCAVFGIASVRMRDLDGGCGIMGRAMRDRQHRHDGGAVGFALDGEDDDARPVFLSFFPSGLVCPRANKSPQV